MTFTAECDATDLAQAAQRAAQLIDSRLTVPILSNVLLRLRDGRLELAATNLDQSLLIAVPAAGQGEATLPAAQLAAAAGRLDAGKPVRLGLEGSQAIIAQGRARWKLPALPPEDFPAAMVEPVEGQVWEVESAPLIARIEEVAGAASTGGKGGRPWLEGIYFDLAGDAPALAATEGFARLAIACMQDLQPPRVPGFILPLTAIRPLADLAKIAARITATLSRDVVTFAATSENRDEMVRTRLIDGQFPDYRRIVPAQSGNRIALDAAGLARALARAAVIDGDVIEAGRGKKRRHAVRLDIGEGEITVTARSQAGEAADVCECQHLGGEMQGLTVNTAHLTWAADSLGQADSLEIGFDPEKPIVITRASDAETRRSLRLIMPMRG